MSDIDTPNETTTIESERIEYRLQPAGLGTPVMPAEAGTLYALPTSVVKLDNANAGYFDQKAKPLPRIGADDPR